MYVVFKTPWTNIWQGNHQNAGNFNVSKLSTYIHTYTYMHTYEQKNTWRCDVCTCISRHCGMSYISFESPSRCIKINFVRR
jgi:rubrerythrin